MFKKSLLLFLFSLLLQAAIAQCYTVLTYCTPTFQQIAGVSMGMQNVTLGSTINNSTVATGLAPNYFDYTSMSVAGAAGTSIYGSVINGAGNNTKVRIYIDWNQDGVYNTTAPELVWSSYNNTASALVLDTIAIPAGQTAGVYRIRFAGDFGSLNNNSPCVLTYGEVEDYTLVVTSATSDASVIANTSPAFFIAGSNNIGFSMANLGTSAMNSVNIGYQLGTNTPVTQSLTGLTVAPGGVYNASFATALSIPSIGSYNLKVWLNNVNGGGTQTPANDTLCRSFFVYCSSALNGTYTIDPAGSGSTNFARFGAADSAMISCGISGPVVFNVAAGTYNATLDIPNITGSSATNTITFDGGNGNAATRILTAATTASAPFVVRFNGCSNVIFRNMTVRATGATDGWAVHFLDGVNNRLNNCYVEITGSGATSSNGNLAGVVINGSATGMSGSSSIANNHTVDSCTINAGYYNVYCSTTNGANTLSFNRNSMNSAYYYGMYFNSSIAAKIRNNTIDLRTTNANNEGIHLINCNASGTNFHEMIGNKITNAGQYGMWFQTSSGSGSAYGLIYNNMIGGGFRSTSGCYGINDNSSNYKIWHNSINMDFNSSSGSTFAIYLSGGSLHDIQNNHLVINATAASNAYPLYTTSPTYISVLDFNNLYNKSSTSLYYNGTITYTVSNFRTAFSSGGAGTNSINSNPYFIAATNLHTTMPCNNGANLGVTVDIDGNARGTSPDIGADEMTTIPNNDIGVLKINTPSFPLIAGTQSINVTIRNFGNNTITAANFSYQVNGGSVVSAAWTGSLAPCDTLNYTFSTAYSFTAGSYLTKIFTDAPNGVADVNTLNDTLQASLCPAFSGNYTINPLGSGATNFTSFNNAVTAINCGGVYGAVNFLVSAGTYSEQVTIGSILGATSLKTVTFKSVTGVASDVILTYNSTNPAANYTVQLNGSNYVNFKNITVSATNVSYATALSIVNNASNDSFYNVVFNGISTTNSGTNYAVIYSPSGISNFLYFDFCKVNDGYYGSYFSSNSVIPSTENLSFNNCDFVNQYGYGFYNQYLNGLRLTGNRIITNSSSPNYTGMYNYWIMTNVDNNRPLITGNKVSGAVGGNGIWNSYFGVNSPYTVARRPLIANNMISMGSSNNSTYGLRSSTEYWADYIHNSVSIGTSDATSNSAAAYFEYPNSSPNTIQNNIFAGSNGAAAVRNNSPASYSIINFNDLYSTGTNLAYINAAAYPTLASWQGASAKDLNSVSLLPGFVSTNNLHISSSVNVKSVATNVLVPTDFDNVLRCSDTTDVGADHHPGANDIGISRVLYPTNGVAGAGARDIVVVLRNFGTNTITSANVSYKDATTTKTIAWTGTLGLCDSTIVTFTGANQYTFTGAWNLKYFTDSPNGIADSKTANDTMRATGCTGMAGVYTINPSGSGTSNYTTFALAIAAMGGCGVGGPVVFNVAAATYNEQVSIPAINGASAINTVTFDGGNGNFASRILTFLTSAAAPHTLRFNNCNYVTVRNMTIRSTTTATAWVVNFLDGTNNRLNNCKVEIANEFTLGASSSFIQVVFNGNATSSTTASSISNNNTMDSCNVIGGYYSVIVALSTNANTVNIINNTINDAYQYGLYSASGTYSLRLIGNTFNMVNARTSPITSNYGLYIQSINNSGSAYYEISGNKIFNFGIYGMYFNSCNNSGTAWNRVYNNMIGGGIKYPSGAFGFYITSVGKTQFYHNSVNFDMATTSGTASAMYIANANGTGNDVRNNILAVTNTAALGTTCFYLASPTAVSNVDYNNYYNLSSPILMNNGGVNLTSSNFKIAGAGSNSINVNPYFVSGLNLHTIAACNNGTNLGVTTDIDGDARGATPDIGADELGTVPSNDIGVMKINSPAMPFASGSQVVNVTIRNYGGNVVTAANINYVLNGGSVVTGAWTGSLAPCDTANYSFTTPAVIVLGSNNLIAYTTAPNAVADANSNNDTAQWTICTGLTGVYTINPGGSGPTNFTTFAAATAALGCGGVYGAVTFNVAAATYNEQVNVPQIVGASAINTVTFQGFSSGTRVISAVTTAALPYVVRFNNCDYVTFRNFTIRGTGTTTTWVTHFLNGTNNRVNNCIIDFTGTGVTSTGSNFIPVVVNGDATSIGTTTTAANNHTIDSCAISYGYYSFYVTMISDANKLNVINNTVNDAYYYGFFSQNGAFSPRISGNTFNLRTAGSVNSQGIFLQSCSNNGSNYIDISANKILNAGQYGIYLNSCFNNSSAFNTIYNNMIGGGFRNLNTTSGMFLQNVSHTQVYHNSINFDVAATAGINSAIYFNAGSTNDVRNNILAVSNTLSLNTYCLYLSAASVLTNLDNNVYYNRSSTNLVSIAGLNYTPATFKAAFPTGGGLGAINFNPFYFSGTNLHTTTACNNGVNLGVTLDIDGQTRAAIPDIGADEVIAVPANDIGVMKVNSPAFPMIAGSQSINVTLRNYGNSVDTSAVINYRVNGGTVVSQTWTGVLAPCDTLNFTFTTPYTFLTGSSVLQVFTTLPNANADANTANDTLQTTLCTVLNGSYTINPSGSGITNYTSFTNAINAIACGGITGPVTFLVSAATYTEQLTIPLILGSSAVNTVTFDGGNGNMATRIITYAGTAALPPTVYFNLTSNIIFRNLTIQTTGASQGWGVNLFHSNNCKINNCVVEVAAPGNVSTSSNFQGVVISGGNNTGNYTTNSLICDNNTIDSSTIKAGYYGIYTSIGTSAVSNYFLRNTMTDQYWGAYYFNSNQTVKCKYNTISVRSGNVSSDAITLFNANSAGTLFHEISYNSIQNAGNRGIYMATSAGSSAARGQIYNNFIGGGFSNTAANGIYTTSGYYNIWHNTINMDAPLTSSGSCIYFASGSTNDVRNNIFAITNSASASGYCIYTASTTYITTLDYNIYFNKLGANLLYLAGVIKTPANYKTAYTTGGGLNSLNRDPGFNSNTNLHIINGCNNGTNLGVVDDYDGETRSTTPDMGADEIPVATLDAAVTAIRNPTGSIIVGGTPYTILVTVRNQGTTTLTSVVANYSINGAVTSQTFTSGAGLPAGGLLSCDTIQLTFAVQGVFGAGGPSFFKAYTGNVNGSSDLFHLNDTLTKLYCTPFSGSFTINSLLQASNTNFTSFTSAVAAVYNCGVTGPVVFRAAPGSGPYNEQITFTGPIPGATAVNTVSFKGGLTMEAISFNAGVATNQHTIRLSNVKHVILDSLTINALNITNGIGVHITNIADSNYVRNCIINIAGTNLSNTAGIAISSTTSLPTGTGNNGNKNTIQNNYINGGYYGITAFGTSTTTFNNYNQILGNTLSGVYQYGMYISYQDNIKMNGNTVSTSNLNVNNYGMYLQYVDRFEIKKNKINNVGSYGIYFSTNANYQNNLPTSRAYIVNNMIGGTFYATSGYAIYLGGNTRDLDIQHNSVSVYNAGSLYAFMMQQTATNQYTGLDIRNNSFVGYNCTGYVAYFYYTTGTGTPFTYLNYNNIWNSNTSGSTVVINQSGYSGNGWIGALGWNVNSKALDPLYINPQTNLHTIGANLENVGTNLATVTDDIDGDVRPLAPASTVDIGADEFNKPANDAGIIALVSPGVPMTPGLQDVVVLMKNFGTNTLVSVNVHYKVGVNGAVKTMPWTGSLVTNATTTVTFTTPNQYNFIGTIVDTVISWTSLPNTVIDEYRYNDTLTTPVCKSLLGAYTINPLGVGLTNYTSFAQAIAAVSTCGVGGPVVFTVSPGKYTGRLILTPIPNSSLVNTVTFDGLDSAACKIVDSVGGTAANPAVITFNGADFITFKNFGILAQGVSVGVGVLMNGGADYNTIKNCNIRVSETSTSSNCFGIGVCGTSFSTGGVNGNYNTFDRCAIIGGYVGASFYGTSTTINDNGNALTNSTLLNMYQYGVYSQYEYLNSVIGNTVRCRTTGTFTTSTYGMYFYYTNGTRVERNTVANAGAYGIYIYLTNYSGPNLGSRGAVTNNIIITNTSYSSPTTLYAYYPYNTDIFYNTVYTGGNPTSTSYAANISYGGSGTDVRNNIFYNTGSVNGYVLQNNGPTFTAFDNNIMYTASPSLFATWNGTSYLDFSSLKSATPLFHQKSMVLIPNFVSTTLLLEDLHLNTFAPGQQADKTVPVAVDVDNEPRCLFAPTIGADESKYNSGNPLAGFSMPDTIFVNSPMVFTNINPANAPLGHRWYVDGNYVGNTLNLPYTFNATSTYTVKLVTFGCVGVDSIEKTIVVYNPTRVPVTDFVANLNVVETYQQIQLTDLSTNGPTFWYWTFNPNVGVNFNNGTTNFSQNPAVSFSFPGLYEICLWDSNSVGRSAQVCKTAYVLVKAINNMCIFPFDTKVSTGTLYDEGGPTGNYSANGTCNFLIDPCASSVNLIFSSFSLSTNSYIRIYNGTSNAAPALHPGTGFSGTTIPGGTAGITATSGKMYIEFVKGTAAAGFAASWTSVASSSTVPVGTLENPDTAYDCGGYFTQTYHPSSTAFDRDGAYYKWYFDYTNSSFPDVEGKGLYTQDWSYGSLGTYIVRLDIEGCGGIETIYDTIIVDHPSTGPRAAFKANMLVATPADLVMLTDLSTIDPVWWLWTITGPGPVTSVSGNTSSKNYGVRFSTPGYYTVMLKDSNCVGSDTLTKTAYIKIIDYCVPTVSNLNPDFSIERFVLGRADTIINATVYGLDYTNIAPAVGTTTYRDNTNKFTTYFIKTVTLANQPVVAWLGLGETYDFNVKRQSNFNAANFKIWIDYNQDGIFQTTELAASSGLTSGANFVGSITVPASASLGFTRLRIGTNFDLLSNTPCGTNTFGDFNDFRVNITPDITAPSISITGNIDSVYVEVGRVFNDPGTTVVGATTVTHSGFAYGATVTAFPFLGIHTITASDASLNTTIRNVYVRATKDITLPVITKTGADTVYSEVGAVYSDLGATATDFYFGSLTSSIIPTSTVNINVLGVYTVTYNVNDAAGNAAVSKKRVVIVRDTQKPVITISGSNPLYISVNSTFTPPSATVTDNYNTGLPYTITGGPVNSFQLGTYSLFYNAVDSSGNTALTKTLTVIVQDITPPQITLIPKDTVIIDCITLTTVPEPGFIVSDNYATPSQITVSKKGAVNLNVIGTYSVRYYAADPSGNIDSSKVRVYVVVDRGAPVISLIGALSMNWPRWKNFVEPGTSVYDKCDPTATAIPDYSKLNIYLDGLYDVTYSCTDASGNKAAPIIRYVNIYTVANGLNANGSANLFKVYPNPNNGLVTVDLNIENANAAIIMIYDANGKIVYHNSSVNAVNSKMQIDLSSEAAGMYFIKVVTDSFTASKTFSIRK